MQSSISQSALRMSQTNGFNPRSPVKRCLTYDWLDFEKLIFDRWWNPNFCIEFP